MGKTHSIHKRDAIKISGTNELLLKQAKAESKFFDKIYSEADKRHSAENYKIPDEIVQKFTDPRRPHLVDFEFASSLLGDLRGKKLLDYGAGDGWTAVSLARAGARVWAIDISEKGIELTKKKAMANGVAESIIAEVQNCYKTTYPDSMFDRIYGGGILHHLDVKCAGKELSRLLRRDGVAVFFEPIRETKIMDVIKAIVLKVTGRKPSEETENESPMTERRINLLKGYFGVVNFRYFNILSSASLLFSSQRMKDLLLRLDYTLIKVIPGFKKLGRAVVIELREPVKGDQKVIPENNTP